MSAAPTAGKCLEVLLGEKGQPMWVFDGEEWVQDNGSETRVKSETPRPRYEEMMPELQVIEIVPVPQPAHVPPLPLP